MYNIDIIIQGNQPFNLFFTVKFSQKNKMLILNIIKYHRQSTLKSHLTLI